MLQQKRIFYLEKPKKISCMVLSNVCDVLTFLVDNNFVRFGIKLDSCIDK